METSLNSFREIPEQGVPRIAALERASAGGGGRSVVAASVDRTEGGKP